MEEINERLARVRSLGVSRSVPERFGTGITAYGAPIFDDTGQVAFALTAVGRNSEVGEDERDPFPTALRREAQALSERLAIAAKGTIC
jgi:DNA-binding IclR family transcriptional regulator